MKEEIPNKKPSQTIKKYQEEGNRIRVDFLEGESIYLQNTPKIKEKLNSIMNEDIASLDKDYKKYYTQQQIIKNVGYVAYGGGIITSVAVYLLGAQLIDAIPLTMAGLLIGSVPYTIGTIKSKYFQKLHLYHNLKDVLSDPNKIKLVRQSEKFATAQVIGPNDIDHYSLEDIQSIQDRLSKIEGFEVDLAKEKTKKKLLK